MNTEKKHLTIAQERLKDAMSLIILLENDMTTLHADDMYTRVLHMVHSLIRSAMDELSLTVQSAQESL